MTTLSVRAATAADRESLGRFGGALTRQHHEADPRRFLRVEEPEAGYGRYLVSQIDRADGAVLVAEQEGRVIGYVWATLEDTDWMQLRGPCGVIQDIFVEDSARRLGAGGALLEAALAWIRSHERTLVVLMTRTSNEGARRLFASFGFRPTMLEMSLDVASPEPPA